MSSRLDDILHRKQGLTILLSDPEVTSDSSRYTKISKEFSDLEPVAEAAEHYLSIQSQINENQELLLDPDCDKEFREMAEAEIRELRQQLEESDEKLTLLLLPKDPNDDRNIILEIRAGTGGDEAALFAADLFRMYSRYAEQLG